MKKEIEGLQAKVIDVECATFKNIERCNEPGFYSGLEDHSPAQTNFEPRTPVKIKKAPRKYTIAEIKDWLLNGEANGVDLSTCEDLAEAVRAIEELEKENELLKGLLKYCEVRR